MNPVRRLLDFLSGTATAPARIARIEAALDDARARDAASAAEIERLRHDLWMLTGAVSEQRREQQLLLGRMSLPEAGLIPVPPVAGDGPDAAAFPHSSLCRQDSFETPGFDYWSRQLGTVPRYHRKLWEFVFICQVLHERGYLVPGAHGLGFGVGGEPLSAYFISRGARITATDMAAEEAAAAGWTATAQHAAGIATLRRPDLCPDDLFERNIAFRTVDMNAVPDDLEGFDFCWSACALEHLGSIEAGLAFIRRSIVTLRPGGLAVHTTEFNVSSNEDTLSTGGTVLFRRRDIDGLIAQLQADGHEVAPMDYDAGDRPIDRYIDVPPYRAEPHLKLALSGYAATSIGLIIRRGA